MEPRPHHRKLRKFRQKRQPPVLLGFCRQQAVLHVERTLKHLLITSRKGYSSSMLDAVNFHWNAGKVRLISGGVALVAAIGLVMLFQDSYGVKALGLVWIGALLTLAVALLRRSNSSDPVVVVDARGIRDSRISDHIILWEDIRAVDTLDAENVTFVGIDLKADAVIQPHLRAMHRIMLWPNRILHFPSLSIAMHALDGTTSDLLAAVARFRPNLIMTP